MRGKGGAGGQERVAQEDLPLLNDLHAALQHERQTAWIALYRAAGGGWKL